MKRFIYSAPLIPIAITVSVVAITSCSKTENLSLKNTEIESKKCFGIQTTLTTGKSYTISALLGDWTVTDGGKPTRTEWILDQYTKVSIFIQALETPKSEDLLNFDNIKVSQDGQSLERKIGGFETYYDPDTKIGRINIFDNGQIKVPYLAAIVVEGITCKENQKVNIWVERTK